MKKSKIVICGMLGLIVFGLLISQPLQALLVIVDSPIKAFFEIHTFELCIVVGIIQGVCEECGYYLMFSSLLKNEVAYCTPVLFGIGRGSLELIYNVMVIFVLHMSVMSCIIYLVSRLFGFGCTIGLTMLDYFSYHAKCKCYLIISIIFHAIMNSMIYAVEIGLLKGGNNLEAWLMIVASFMFIILELLISRRYRISRNQL